jgi:hypothetical protein
MKIVKWEKDRGGQMVRISKKEALLIIQSLTSQMLSKNCNIERAEFTTEDGSYFSIAVHCEKED